MVAPSPNINRSSTRPTIATTTGDSAMDNKFLQEEGMDEMMEAPLRRTSGLGQETLVELDISKPGLQRFFKQK